MTPPRKLTRAQHIALLADLARGTKTADAARRYGISERSVRRYREERDAGPGRWPAQQPCGTPAAYVRHRRKKERCPECWAAWSAYCHRVRA